MDRIRQDLAYGARGLWANKGFSVPALLTLTLAIGVSTAIFSLVYGVLLRPLPYPNAAQLVRLAEVHVGAMSATPDAVISNVTFEAWARDARAIEAFAAYGERAYTVTGAGDSERVPATAVSPSLFRLFHLTPAAGRFFDGAEAAAGADDVVVLGHGFWRQRFGGRADVIGQTITLDARPRVIVGVAPPGFSFPDRDRQLYTPFVVPRTSNDDGTPLLRVFPAIARLAPGATPAQASAEGTAVLSGLGPRPVSADLLFGHGGTPAVRVRGLVDEVTARVRPMLLLLGIGVVLVLIVSCANVINLFLFRTVAREHELAIRGALGAGRGRLIQQLATESMLLAGGGGVLGTLLAWQLIAAWPALAPRGFPRLEDVTLNWIVIAFSVTATFAAGVVAGIVPAMRGAPTNLVAGLREASGASRGLSSTALRRGLLVIETALAAVLLVGSTLLIQSFVSVLATDTGYDASQVVSARVSLQGGAASPLRWQGLASRILERVRAIPGVESAGAANMVPLGDSTFMVGFRMPGNGPEPVIARAIGYIVTPGYAEALRLRLQQGRLLSPADTATAAQAMLVNERFVTTYLADGQPVLGRRYAGLLAPNITAEIVGVVSNVLRGGLLDAPQPEIYVGLGNHGLLTLGRDINLVVRTVGDPSSVSGSLRSIVATLDPIAPVHHVTLLASELSATAGELRLAMAMLTAFSVLALLLAAVGQYGALSYWVTGRRRELAIRSALGASQNLLVTLVLVEGFSVTAIGLGLGLAASAASGRLMHSLVIGVEPLNVVAFGAAGGIMTVVTLAACVLPARRASALAPRAALTAE